MAFRNIASDEMKKRVQRHEKLAFGDWDAVSDLLSVALSRSLSRSLSLSQSLSLSLSLALYVIIIMIALALILRTYRLLHLTVKCNNELNQSKLTMRRTLFDYDPTKRSSSLKLTLPFMLVVLNSQVIILIAFLPFAPMITYFT